MNTCKTCTFLLNNPNRMMLNSVVCRRHPPQSNLMLSPGVDGTNHAAIVSTYPVVGEDLPACGEYRERPASTARV